MRHRRGSVRPSTPVRPLRPVRIEVVRAATLSPGAALYQQSDLISSLIRLELDCGLSTRGEASYQTILTDSRYVLVIATRRATQHDDPGGRILIGCFSAMVVLDELQIDNVAVATSWRGRGIAFDLITTGLSLARQLECRTAFLEVRTANLAARQLYLKSGFVEAGRRPGYYQNPPDDAIVMACDL